MEARVKADAPAELVVVNGRLGGVRRPLVGPMTLLGRAEGCEIRLNVDGVQPLHAALISGQEGFFLRDLAGNGDVLLNDQPAALARVHHGDVVGVGSFRFRLQLANPSPEKAAESERDAVRIQAAAVAAQQSALNEEEIRLEQRRVALDKQEEQLAGHLEERRRQLLQLQEQTQQERQTLQIARTKAMEEQVAAEKELLAARAGVEAADERARTERQQLVELRKRMLIRAKSHWQGRESVLARREKELVGREARLQRAAGKMARGHAALVANRLRLNSDLELGKRRLREQWQELGVGQQQWEVCLNKEHAEREKRVRDLEARIIAVEEAERSWNERERSARLMLADLYRESTGLETRIGNLREKLAQEETAVARLQALRTAPEPVAVIPSLIIAQPSVASSADRTVFLRQLAGRLGDQRAHLLEQWQTLLRVQDEWRVEREQAMVELESGSRSLQEEERRLTARERELDAAAEEWRQRQQALSQSRLSLEGRLAQLMGRETAWQGEKARVLTDAEARQEAAELHLRRLRNLARRREMQRGKEAEQLASARSRYEDMRLQYVALWRECQQRRQEIAREQRDMAARTLALEQMRQEFVAAAPNAATFERRLHSLRKRAALRLKASDQAVETANKDLAAESDRLNELANRLNGQENELKAHQERLIRQQAAWDEREAAAEDAEARRRFEVERLRAGREQDARRIAQLLDEVERIAGVLMDEPEIANNQAA